MKFWIIAEFEDDWVNLRFYGLTGLIFLLGFIFPQNKLFLMARQKFENGMEWALALFLPVGAKIILIPIIAAEFGGISAGFAHLLLTLVVLTGIILSAKYWHIPSTIGFLMAGLFLWITFPNVSAEFFPWPFEIANILIYIIFFSVLVKLLADKLGIGLQDFN